MTTWYLALALMLGWAVATNSAAQQAPCPTPSSTFEIIQRGVFEQHGCTRDYCHGASKQAGLDLRAGASYDSLLNESPDDQQYKLVEPGRPEDSLLWLLLAAKTLQRPNVPGEPMPIGTVPLSPDELEGVRLWISAGAPAQGVVGHVADLIQVCSQGTGEDDANLPRCDRNDPSLLLPELAPEPPKDIRLGSSPGISGVHRMIWFSTVIANTGAGPLIIQAASRPSQPGQLLDAEQVILRRDGSKCAHPAGAIRFGDNGSSWEYAHVANFELRKDNPTTGDGFALKSKTYFCLLDTDAIRSAHLPHQYEAHCTDNIGRMGISAGWKDTYHRLFPGQWIDLNADPAEPVAPGSYYLVNIANPTNELWEMDDSLQSNLSYTRVTVTSQDPDPPAVQPTPPTSECQSVAHPKVVVGKLNTPPGDDTLTFQGSVTLPGFVSPLLNPLADGVRLHLEDTAGSILDLAIPGGAFTNPSGVGWKVNRNGTKWTYQDKTAAPPDGIFKVVIQDKSARTLGLVTFVANGRKGSYVVGGTDLPVSGDIAFSGHCADATFAGPAPAPHCAFNKSGSTLNCK
jgi:hypothetical protein